jgi:hypothetical protein
MSKTVSYNRGHLVLAAIGVIALGTVGASSAQAQSALSPPVSAHAGYWADTACSEGGEPISGADWQPGGSPPYPFDTGIVDTCQFAGGSLTLRDEGVKDSTPGTGPAWIYEARGDSAIVGGFVDLTMLTPGGEASLQINNGRGEWTPLAKCDESCTTLHGVTATIPSTEDWILTAQAVCRAPSGKSACATSGVNSEMSISRSTILMDNTGAPQAGAVTGSLTESPVSGTASVAFKATDALGPGVYRVAVAVDGKEVVSETPETSAGKCVPHGTYEKALNFHSFQPCPPEVAVHVEVPTTQLSDGTHLVEVILEDAAGHKVIAFDKRIDFENGTRTAGAEAGLPASSPPPANNTVGSPSATRGPANGTPSSEQATLTTEWASSKPKHTPTAHLATTYGHGQRVAGKLTDPAGAPIANAAIEVTETAAQVGASPKSLAVAHTTAGGTFAVTLPPTLTSGTVSFSYRSHLGDPLPAATSSLTVSMPAKVALTVSPDVTSVGETIVFTGRIAGPIPPGGKQVVVEAREHGGEWVQFHTSSTDASGTFHAKHRFKYAGPALYEFRAICKHEADFPFAEGKSGIVRVRET